MNRMAAPENILLIRLKSIGDVLLTLPSVNAVRANFPDAKITFLTSAENASLLRGFREVNEVITLNRAVLRGGNPLKAAAEIFRLLQKLRAGKFSRVVDFQGYGETAWLTRLTGAPQRWGVVYSTGRSWAYTRRVARVEKIHPANGNLEMLRQCGLNLGVVQNEFALPADVLTAAQRFFAEQKLLPDRPTLFLQPFTSSPHKNWPLENFIALARQWQSHGGQVIFGGGPADREKLQSAAAAGFPISAGVPLLVTGGLMKLATLVVGGDTGAVHLAVALGRRVVMLMTSLTPGSPHPFGQPDWTVIAQNNLGVPGISLATVSAACKRALDSR
jgi:ADP-heptose:LPS heptosyltransferase